MPNQKTKLNYFQQIWRDFLYSFKGIDKRFFTVVLLDLLLISMLYLGIEFLWKIIAKKLNYIPPMPIFDPNITPASELRSFYDTVTGINREITLYIIIFSLVMLLIWTFVKNLQWGLVLKKRFKFRLYLKAICLNLIWHLSWILIFILNFLLFKNSISKAVSILLLLIYLHLSYIKYMQIAKTEKIFSSIIRTLKTGILRVYMFLIPYLLMAIVLLLISQMYYLYKYLPENIQIVAFLLIIIIWVAWSRAYTARIIEKI